MYLKGKKVIKRMRHSDPNELNANSSVGSNISENSNKIKSIDSKILNSLKPIEKHFDGRSINKAQLLFRASD